MNLYNDDCLNVMKNIKENSVDFVFCDLPYGNGHTACKWDVEIDLEQFWKLINKITKKDAPVVFTGTAKFGVKLINSNPKNFRYDLIWVKSAPCGFLNSLKMPMKKHEILYVFYRKLPKVYTENIKLHHNHKFKNSETYNYDQKTQGCYGKPVLNDNKDRKNGESRYDPPLPTTVVKEEKKERVYGRGEDVYKYREKINDEKHQEVYAKRYLKNRPNYDKGDDEHKNFVYDPPLPNTILEVKSEKGKHQTQKPVELIKWLLKYYTSENDVVLDPTMGSGTTGVACREMNRNFIGIEKDKEIYNFAYKRIIPY